MNYELYMGTYYMMEGKRLVYGCDEVAIAFTKEQDGTYILMKHGDPVLVKDWIDKTRKLYEDSLTHTCPTFYVISGKFPVEDLNRILDTTGWVKYFLQKHNISLEDKKVMEVKSESS